MAVKRKKVARGTVKPSAHVIPVRGGVVQVAPPAPAPGVLTPDSQYYADAAQRTFDLNQGLAANDRQATDLVTARDEALRRLADQQPKDESSSRISANKAGLLHSTTLGNAMSDLAQAYVRQRGDVQSSYDSNEAARLAARKALEEGAPIADAAARADAADRQTGRDAEAAAANSLVPNAPTVKPPAPRPVVPKVVKPKRRRVTMGRVTPSSRVIGARY